MDSVQRRLRNTAEQTGRQATHCGLAHLLVLLPPSQEQHTGSGTEAGEVPRTHRTLDEVIAQGLDVDEHDRVDRPVQTQRHHERVCQRNEDREDQRGEIVDGLQESAERRTGVDADRTDQERGQRNHDQHRQERHEDQLHVLRNDPFQEFVQQPKYSGHQQRREDLRAVVEDRQRQSEDLHDVDLGAEHGRGLGEVLQRGETRQHDHGHDGEPDPRIGAQFFRGVVGDHQRQEHENALPAQVDELPGRRQLAGLARVGPVGDDVERAHQSHESDEQRGTEQRAKDRAEGVGQELEEPVEPGKLSARTLGAGGGLDRGGIVAAGATAEARQCLDLVVDGLHATADHNLIAVTGLRDGSHDAGHSLQIGLLDPGGIVQGEPQPGGAVRETLDIGRTPELLDDLGSGVRRHSAQPFGKHPGRVPAEVSRWYRRWATHRIGLARQGRYCRARAQIIRR